MTKEQALARPMLGFQILKNPEQPTLAIFAAKTVEGVTAFLVNREILEMMVDACRNEAKTLPRKTDQN